MRRTKTRRTSWITLAFCVLALTAPIGLGADTYPRQPGVDAQHYRFALTLLTDDSNVIQGHATVTLKITQPGVRTLFLDLASATGDGTGMTVDSVTSAGQTDGQPVTFTHRNDRLELPVPPGTAVGDNVSFTVAYHGIPANGLRQLNNIHGDRTAFSENWYNRARQWLPMIDHIADKATGEFIITTNADYQVIGNGALIEQLDLPNGLRRTHWSQAVPISSWLYSIGIARFIVKHDEVIRGIPMSYWAFPQDADKGIEALSRDARGSFEYFSDQVGPFAYQKLAHVEAAGMGGGTEHASNIFYGEKSITAGNGPVVHETAHQWFGDAVTEDDWNDVWLSEGFATYFTLLYTEHAQGRDAFVDGLRRSRQTVLQLEARLPDTPVVHVNLNEATTGPNNGLVYQKGAWALHMLRNRIGTDTFWRGIRLYYQRHFNGVASTDDFQRAMEEVSGEHLQSFFDQWLRRAGVPKVEGTWRYDSAAKAVVVTIRQTQAAAPFAFPLDIGVGTTAEGLPQITTIDVTGREATVRIPSATAPMSVLLDPDVRLLADFGSFTR